VRAHGDDALGTHLLGGHHAEQVAEGNRAMDDRRAIKTLLRPEGD
jgi:hypothetical protein